MTAGGAEAVGCGQEAGPEAGLCKKLMAAAAPRAPAGAGGVCSDPTLAILVGVQVFTVVTALLAVAANVWVMVQSTSSITVKDIALRVYAIIFCGVIIPPSSSFPPVELRGAGCWCCCCCS